MLFIKHHFNGLIAIALLFANSLVAAIPSPFFRENKGQVSDQAGKPRPDVLYSGTNGQSVFHLTKNSISFQFLKVEKWEERDDLKTGKKERTPAMSSIYRLDLEWMDANPDHDVIAMEQAPGYENFYSSACPNGAVRVRSFSDVSYKELYKGIDLHFYEKNGGLKYDYILQPGADHRMIRLKVSGAEKIEIGKSGELIIKSPLGIISEPAPIASQEGKLLKANWKINRDYIGFEIEGRDLAKSLVIDPLVRAWGTYYGNATGTDASQIYGTCTDASGNVYASGETFTGGLLIATTGSHQQSYALGGDAFLAKFNTNGQRLWATFYGGNSSERGYACARDAFGNVYLAGTSTSGGPAPGNGIATIGSHQPSLNTQYGSAFLAKFDAAGIRQWGTFYGGTLNENGFACTTDAAGNVYLAGQAESSNGIATSGSYQQSFGGNSDCFLVKFNSAGVRQWGTYLGGPATMGSEAGLGCAADPSGNVYLCGIITQSTIIGGSGSFQPNFIGGENDGFIAKFDANGGPLWATYYGIDMFAGTDETSACVTDSLGNVYITGSVCAPPAFSTMTPLPAASASSLIATTGVYMPQPAAGSGYNAYLAKFNSTGQRQWGTFFGYNSRSSCCSVDRSGKIYIGGVTSGTVSMTAGSHQPNATPMGDAYFAQFDPNCMLLYSTYYGGAREEWAYACATDLMGNFYLAGFTNSFGGTSIATLGSQQPSYPGTNLNGAPNSFLAKFADCSALGITSTHSNVSCFGLSDGSATVSASAGGDPLTYAWTPGGNTNSFASSLAAGIYTCIVTTSCGVISGQTFAVINPPAITLTAVPVNTVVCVGSTATLNANASGGTGAFTYSWSGGPSSNGLTTATVIATSSPNYSVLVSDANGCTKVTAVTLNINQCAGIGEVSALNEIKVFPNPGTGLFQVQSATPLRIKIYDANGRLVSIEEINETNSTIDLKDQAAGLYLFVAGEGGNTFIVLKE